MVKPMARPRALSVGRGADRLVFDVMGEVVLEGVFVAVELEPTVFTSRLVKSLWTASGIRVGEGNEGLLGPSQIERGFVGAALLLANS